MKINHQATLGTEFVVVDLSFRPAMFNMVQISTLWFITPGLPDGLFSNQKFQFV
jgi:hypothetical protein